jgi:UDP-N-acetylmuramate--alanine ligase
MKAAAAHTIYFLGIGGIGMSALARYFLKMGKEVYGYDLTATPLTRQLESEGMQIHYTEDIDAIPAAADYVIYTPAIPADNKELQYFQHKGLPLVKRAEVIGQLTQDHFTIAVAGTHGKTSICAIASHMLHAAGIKLTAFVGGIMKNPGSNLVVSDPTEVLLVEADEFDRSFLQIEPDMAVVSSMDADHLDIYGEFGEMEKNFLHFTEKLSAEGLLIYNDKLEVFTLRTGKKLSYGFDSASDVRAENVRVESGRFLFDLAYAENTISGIRMIIPGRHYVENALAAASIALELGVGPKHIKKGLETFTGVERRFDLRFEDENTCFIDDYAHHPEEILATVAAVRELHGDKKITGIFQPHLFSRTRDHAAGFAQSLEGLDKIILLDIYPAREKPVEGITSRIIFDQIKNPDKVLLSKKALLHHLKHTHTEVVITIGAGDIGLMVEDIESIIKNK